ncbi:MAG: PQQ-binding-like beta-propeller repeat protein [Actinobacteria bacterium]|nr:PQQ-binding-like beta-propeller repeat protein [Actinomycetota bacterium]
MRRRSIALACTAIAASFVIPRAEALPVPVGTADAVCTAEAATKGARCQSETWGSQWLTPGRVGEVRVATRPGSTFVAGAYDVLDPEAADRWRVEVFASDLHDGAQRWRRTLGGPETDNLVDDVVTGGGIVVTRIAGSDVVTTALAPEDGATRWEYTLTRVPGAFGPQASVVTDPAGGSIYVAAHDTSGAVVVAYDAATGTRRWVASLPAAPVGTIDLAVSASSLAVSVPRNTDADPVSDAATISRLDPATGDVVWSTAVVSAVDTDPRAVALSDDGATVFVVDGNDARFEPPARAFVAGLDTTNGAVRWQDVYEGNGDVAVLDAAAGANLYIAAMEIPEAGTRDGLAIAYGPAGNVAWEQRDSGLGLVGDEGFRTLAVDPAHEAVTFVGRADPMTVCTPIGICLARAFDVYAVSYDDASGARRWLTHWGERPLDGDEYGNDIAVSPDARGVIVSGAVKTAEDDFGGDFDPVVLRYDEPPGGVGPGRRRRGCPATPPARATCGTRTRSLRPRRRHHAAARARRPVPGTAAGMRWPPGGGAGRPSAAAAGARARWPAPSGARRVRQEPSGRNGALLRRARRGRERQRRPPRAGP